MTKIKSMGQHFLTDAAAADRIVEVSGAADACAVLEIGPGDGVLTRRLAAVNKNVTAIELDRRLEKTLSAIPAKFIFADVMNVDFSGFDGVVCANLPYNITTPLIEKMLLSKSFSKITIMIQREVALRIIGEDRGAFTHFCQNRAKTERIFDLPPDAFDPPPKVWSSVITLTPHPLMFDHPKLETVVRAAFTQRRKQLVNSLSAGLQLPRDKIISACEQTDINYNLRAENLTTEEFYALARVIFSA